MSRVNIDLKCGCFTFTFYRTNFRPADWNKTGFLVYTKRFHAVHTELTNYVELNFSPLFPVVLLSANAQSATWANPKWRLPAELEDIHATTPLPYRNLDGYGYSLRAGLKFDLDFVVDNFWTVRRLIKFSYSSSGSVSTQQLNARIYNRSEIRPVLCECSLIFVHTDKTLVSNTMNGFFSQKDQPARISAFKCHEQSKRT